MTGFLNAHGTNPSIFDGQFQDLDFGIADDVVSDDHREVSKWASVEELAMYDPFNEDGYDFYLFPVAYEPRLEYVTEDEVESDGRPGIAILCDGTRIVLEFENKPELDDVRLTQARRRHLEEIEAEKLECELSEADNFMPSFSSNRDKRILNWSEENDKSWRYYRNRKDRKPAQFRVDGKLARKDSPRWSIRHVQVERSDWYHLEYHGEHDYVFEECRPYRFSSYYWDDYDTFDYGENHEPVDDEEYYGQFEDTGPSIEEWTAREAVEIERMLDEVADSFLPSFSSSFAKRKIRGYDQDAKLDSKRSKAHTADRGWRRFAPKRHHGRDSIRSIPIWEMHRYTAMHYLTDNARVN